MNTETRMALSYEDYESVDEPPPGRTWHWWRVYAVSLSFSNSLSALILLTGKPQRVALATLLGDGRAGQL
ncbi:MAG: hypothetical protein ABFD13_04265 [Candidatus Cryosericum sp.]|nr:hypothetical protein [bacterium]